MVPPKCYMFLYGPTSCFSLNLLSLDFHSRGILLTIAIMQEKQPNNLFEIECQIASSPSQGASSFIQGLGAKNPP